MEPSSSTISHKTPAGSDPASMARSTAASVCPALFRTPPSLYFRGNICPGRLKSCGFESFDARANIVVARSRAETPVVVPCFASYINCYANSESVFSNFLFNRNRFAISKLTRNVHIYRMHIIYYPIMQQELQKYFSSSNLILEVVTYATDIIEL